MVAMSRVDRIEQSEPNVSIFSTKPCLAAAVVTAVDAEFHPDSVTAAAWVRRLLADGCDGITLLGTTGEGPEFSLDDRRQLVAGIIAEGVHPDRLMVSVCAQSIPEIVELIRHGLASGITAHLLMPPCIFRENITDEGTIAFYSAVLDRVKDDRLELFFYHFPGICGVPITSSVVRSLDARYPGIIAGIKDSGGQLDHTKTLLRDFPNLRIFTGTEVHVPAVMAQGGQGTICGMANVLPRLMRAILDAPTPHDRQQIVPLIEAIGPILFRRQFVAAIKSLIADATGQDIWRRVVPPATGDSRNEEQSLLHDFQKWETGLPAQWRSLYREAT